jgi:hypothetical protein
MAGSSTKRVQKHRAKMKAASSVNGRKVTEFGCSIINHFRPNTPNYDHSQFRQWPTLDIAGYD